MQNTARVVRVVLVDHSAIVREHVAALLATLEGVEVVGQASDVATGKSLIQQLRPDVLVLDIGLPGESGINLLKAVRPEIASLVIIMFSMYSDPYCRRVCAEAGADYFFDKALEIEGLVEALRALVASGKSGRGEMGHDPDGTKGT